MGTIDIKDVIKQCIVDRSLEVARFKTKYNKHSNNYGLIFSKRRRSIYRNQQNQYDIVNAIERELSIIQSRKRSTFTLEIDLFAAEDTDKFMIMMKKIVNVMIVSNTAEFKLIFRYLKFKGFQGGANIDKSLLESNVKENPN